MEIAYQSVCLNDRGELAAETYHETLWDGFSAWWDKLTEIAAEKGWGIPEIKKDEVSLLPMSYETSQNIIANYLVEVNRSVSSSYFKQLKETKKSGHCLHISIYRMPSGRYEFTAYNG